MMSLLYGRKNKMLHYYNGTIFNTPAKAIVNTVNTTGAMGAGIALEFSLRYPEMFDDYIEKCPDVHKAFVVSHHNTVSQVLIQLPLLLQR